MKKLLVLMFAFASSVVLAQQPAVTNKANENTAPTFKAHVLSNEELDKLLSQPEKILLIDVRRPDEVSSVGGFPVYLSVQLSELDKSLKWIPKDRSIITVSNHANRAGKAADLLASKGFKVLGAVGSDSYEKAGGKAVVHIAIPPPRTAPPAAKG